MRSSRLAGLVGASVKVTLEIDAETEAGAPENVVRTVTEKAAPLKLTTTVSSGNSEFSAWGRG